MDTEMILENLLSHKAERLSENLTHNTVTLPMQKLNANVGKQISIRCLQSYPFLSLLQQNGQSQRT